MPQPIQVFFVPTPNQTKTTEKNSKSYPKKHCIIKGKWSFNLSVVLQKCTWPTVNLVTGLIKSNLLLLYYAITFAKTLELPVKLGGLFVPLKKMGGGTAQGPSTWGEGTTAWLSNTNAENWWQMEGEVQSPVLKLDVLLLYNNITSFASALPAVKSHNHFCFLLQRQEQTANYNMHRAVSQ